MTISPLHPKLEASDVPMEQIAGNKLLTQEQKIGEATRQFEAVLLRQILENTQKTVIKSKYSDDSTASSIYRDMVTNQLAESISKSGGMGLGETLKHEFTQQVKATSLKDGKPEAGAAALTADPKNHFRSARELNPLSKPAVQTHETKS
ncbi:MAG: rod-binding protein [Akkermansiaceae bacterium]|nr:rod-binding protein [Verrucomicrobiales bacterium]